MKKLSLARGFDLPLDAVTQRIAWLGRTGSGKTYGCKRMVEGMLRAKAQVIVLDCAGPWAGLRLGKKSFKIPVLGGLFGDIPLEPTAGALVADLIVDRNASVVLDVSQMIDAERTKFVTAFAQRFFYRKKTKRSAVHLVLEECENVVPQNPQKGEERMLHEIVRIAKQGRACGIGISFVSQRPQEISKKALNQSECVFAFQMTGTHERKALEEWLSTKGMDEDLRAVLPKLKVGSPHVWSPQWLDVSKVVRILPIDTLDTSSTPEVGKKTVSKKLSPIDLKGLSAAMQETIERAKAEDPRELRAELASAKKKIAELERSETTKVPDPEPVPIDWKWLRGEIEASIGGLKAAFSNGMATFEKRINDALCDSEVIHDGKRRRGRVASTQFDGTFTATAIERVPSKKRTKPLPKALRTTFLNPTSQPTARFKVEPLGRDPLVGSGGLMRMMVALAQHPKGLTRRSLGLHAKLSSKTGTFGNYLSQGRGQGWISDDRHTFKLTGLGVTALGHFEPLPEGDALLEHWLDEVGREGGAGRMLMRLHEAYPNALSREELAASANLSAVTGTYGNYLSRLRGLELIEGKDEIRISEELVG